MKKNKCPWCGGSKKIYLVGRGLVDCFNCHGSGVAESDGGRRTSCADKPWLTGNKFQTRNVNK